MSFELPNLDTKDSATLQAELIRRIPQYTTLWTDYNDSDPGITLLQLLCWISESLLYQNNAIPIQTQQNFLREVLGLAFSTTVTPYSEAAKTQYDFDFLALQQVLGEVDAGAPLTKADLQRAVLGFRDGPYLALTLDDVETLALQTNRMIVQQFEQAQQSGQTPPKPLLVQRADALTSDEAINCYVLSDAKPAYQYPPYANPKQPDARGGLRKLLLYQAPAGSAAQAAIAAQGKLLTNVNTYLETRVLLGNRVNVWPAQRTPINLTVSVICPPQVQVNIVLNALVATLFAYFLPGPAWVYNQAPIADNVRLLIENVPGVAAIESFELNYVPTVHFPKLAQLSANTLLADLPPGPPALQYHGLPRLRSLDLYARNSA